MRALSERKPGETPMNAEQLHSALEFAFRLVSFTWTGADFQLTAILKRPCKKVRTRAKKLDAKPSTSGAESPLGPLDPKRFEERNSKSD